MSSSLDKLIIICIIFLFICSLSTSAAAVTLYQGEKPIKIKLRPDVATYVEFPTKIREDAIGNSQFFDKTKVNANQGYMITPKDLGVATNLHVFTEENKYNLQLVARKDIKPYQEVNIKPDPDVNFEQLLRITNRRRISLDPAIRDSVNIYEVKKKIYNFSKLDFRLIRVVTSKSENSTVYYFRASNTTNGKLKIDNTTLTVKNRTLRVKAVEYPGLSREKDGIFILKPHETLDYYLICKKNYRTPSLTFSLKVNEQNETYKLTDLAYSKVKFKLFFKEGNQTESIRLEDYQY